MASPGYMAIYVLHGPLLAPSLWSHEGCRQQDPDYIYLTPDTPILLSPEPFCQPGGKVYKSPKERNLAWNCYQACFPNVSVRDAGVSWPINPSLSPPAGDLRDFPSSRKATLPKVMLHPLDSSLPVTE
jgi:hypothetical protein